MRDTNPDPFRAAQAVDHHTPHHPSIQICLQQQQKRGVIPFTDLPFDKSSTRIFAELQLAIIDIVHCTSRDDGSAFPIDSMN